MAGNRKSAKVPIVRLAKKGDWYSVIASGVEDFTVLRTKDKVRAKTVCDRINGTHRRRVKTLKNDLAGKTHEYDCAHSKLHATENRLSACKRAGLRAEAERAVYRAVYRKARETLDLTCAALVALSKTNALGAVFDLITRGLYAAQVEFSTEVQAGLARIHNSRPALPKSEPSDD